MTATELRKGDSIRLGLKTMVEGIVAKTWKDEETGMTYIEIRTPSRDKRVVRADSIIGQEVLSRNNEVVKRVGRE